MIQPEEVRQVALRWYNEYLTASIQEVPFFPKEVRFGKIKPGDTLREFKKIQNEIDNLRRGSKEIVGYGYNIGYTKKKNQRVGEQNFPSSIYFESGDDFLRFIGKKEEFERFVTKANKIISELPDLRPWVIKHPQKIIDNIDEWDDLIKVCKYFISNPKPNLYIRELPLDLSTKFIEHNQATLKPLLDILIQENIIAEETDFEKRFNLRYNEELIRFRILDNHMAKEYFYGVNDLSIPYSQFLALDMPCKKAFVLENQTNYSNIFNFLTLPNLAESIAIFGKGFQIGLLKKAEWLSDKKIIYWGDIDAHGFQILSQIRGYFPNTKSCLMDIGTFSDFQELAVTGVRTTVTNLPHLTPEEHEMFSYLISKETNNRLEQEKIPHSYAIQKIIEATADS